MPVDNATVEAPVEPEPLEPVSPADLLSFEDAPSPRRCRRFFCFLPFFLAGFLAFLVSVLLSFFSLNLPFASHCPNPRGPPGLI